MRLLLTPILYLGLLCPASVFVTPIRATPIPTSTQLNSDFGNSTPRNLTSSRSRLQTICVMARKFCFHGSCQYLLKAFENNHEPNPETVPDKYSSFRVTKLTYLGSSTHNEEIIMCDVPVPPPKPPSGGYFHNHNADEYWLYIMVRMNGQLRANFVLSLSRSKHYQQANLSVRDFFAFALVGRAGYGSGPNKNQFALIAPNTLIPTRNFKAISFSVDKSKWQPSGTEPRKTETPDGQTVFSFERRKNSV
ncbi:hypothetical protein EV360DRAFT_71687 [Lentinula raphanica]|nr:hypothetical protein EV360DRAFT_71687 [Lentinula raphanica]